MIGENWCEPVESVSQSTSKKGRPDEIVTGQLISHKINRIIKNRSSGQPFGHDPNQRPFIVMGMDNIYSFLADDLAKQTQQPEIEKELLEGMVEQGPLVDGVTALRTATVDGMPFERYAEPLRQFQRME